MKKSDILRRRDVLTEQNFLIREEKQTCEEFVNSYSKEKLWTRFAFGVVGLGLTLGSIGFLPGLIAGLGLMLGSAALLVEPVVKANKILKNTEQDDGIHILNMNTKMQRHYNYLDRVEQLNEEEIKLIDRDLVKDGKPTYAVKEKNYNTKFMDQHKAMIEKLNKSSSSKEDRGQ